MVSAFFDESRGFGLPLTIEEIDMINSERPSKEPILHGDSPGLVFFEYGKNKEGYWDGVKFEQQCEDMLDVLEILYPDMQLLIEVDHSSGHLKEQSDGLEVNKMGMNPGGVTIKKRDTVTVHL